MRLLTSPHETFFLPNCLFPPPTRPRLHTLVWLQNAVLISIVDAFFHCTAAKKFHDSRLMTEVFCKILLILFKSYGRQLRGASIQSGPPSALAIAVADTFRIPFGIATSAAFTPFYNLSSPYYGDQVWCSFDVSPLRGSGQGGVLWVDTHHAWMFNACQRIVDAVLNNVRPLRFVALVTNATERCLDLLLCGHHKHRSIIAPFFHIMDARDGNPRVNIQRHPVQKS